MSAMLMLTSITPVFAQESLKYLPTVTIQQESSKASLPNLVKLEPVGRLDGTGVDVLCTNFGVDGIDAVEVVVATTGYTNLRTQRSYVPAFIGKTFSFNIPMIKCNTTCKVSASAQDGSDIEILPASAHVVYTESNLASANWNRGTRYKS